MPFEIPELATPDTSSIYPFMTGIMNAIVAGTIRRTVAVNNIGKQFDEPYHDLRFGGNDWC
jgi:hypothetical protein